jgi:hypothetical protein
MDELSLQSSMVIKTKKSTRRRLVNKFSDEPVNWRIQIETNLCIPATLNGSSRSLVGVGKVLRNEYSIK